jgi:hypothetical protein
MPFFYALPCRLYLYPYIDIPHTIRGQIYHLKIDSYHIFNVYQTQYSIVLCIIYIICFHINVPRGTYPHTPTPTVSATYPPVGAYPYVGLKHENELFSKKNSENLTFRIGSEFFFRKYNLYINPGTSQKPENPG